MGVAHLTYGHFWCSSTIKLPEVADIFMLSFSNKILPARKYSAQGAAKGLSFLAVYVGYNGRWHVSVKCVCYAFLSLELLLVSHENGTK